MAYFQTLDLGYQNILQVDLQYLIDHHSQFPYSWIVPMDMINPQFLRDLDLIGLAVRDVNIKCSGLGINSWPIHRDEHLHQDQGKINWVYNDDQSPFVWYQLKTGLVDPTLDDQGHALYNDYYDLQDMDVVCETVIKNSTLVQVGVPHSVRNLLPVPRFNVQLALQKDGVLRPTFAQVLQWIGPLRQG